MTEYGLPAVSFDNAFRDKRIEGLDMFKWAVSQTNPYGRYKQKSKTHEDKIENVAAMIDAYLVYKRIKETARI